MVKKQLFFGIIILASSLYAMEPEQPAERKSAKRRIEEISTAPQAQPFALTDLPYELQLHIVNMIAHTPGQTLKEAIHTIHMLAQAHKNLIGKFFLPTQDPTRLAQNRHFFSDLINLLYTQFAIEYSPVSLADIIAMLGKNAADTLYYERKLDDGPDYSAEFLLDVARKISPATSFKQAVQIGKDILHQNIQLYNDPSFNGYLLALLSDKYLHGGSETAFFFLSAPLAQLSNNASYQYVRRVITDQRPLKLKQIFINHLKWEFYESLHLAASVLTNETPFTQSWDLQAMVYMLNSGWARWIGFNHGGIVLLIDEFLNRPGYEIPRPCPLSIFWKLALAAGYKPSSEDVGQLIEGGYENIGHANALPIMIDALRKNGEWQDENGNTIWHLVIDCLTEDKGDLEDLLSDQPKNGVFINYIRICLAKNIDFDLPNKRGVTPLDLIPKVHRDAFKQKLRAWEKELDRKKRLLNEDQSVRGNVVLEDICQREDFPEFILAHFPTNDDEILRFLDEHWGDVTLQFLEEFLIEGIVENKAAAINFVNAFAYCLSIGVRPDHASVQAGLPRSLWQELKQLPFMQAIGRMQNPEQFDSIADPFTGLPLRHMFNMYLLCLIQKLFIPHE